MTTDLDALREGLAEDLVNQIARVIDPDAHHLGRPDYYGPEPILAGSSARVRVARRTAGNIIAGPLAPLIAKAESADAYALVLADCVAALAQVPLGLLPGCVDMMVVSALGAPLPGDRARAEIIAAADRIRAAANARADRLMAACIAVQRSIARFPGSVHDRAMAKIDKALGVVPSDFIDPDEARADRLAAEVEALRAALDEAEACLSIVEPRSDRSEYMRTLGVIRTALAADKPEGSR